MDAANVEQRAAIPFPFFVRKLDKKGTWGHESDEIKARKKAVPPEVFKLGKLRFSLYEIGSLEDLKRVSIALNRKRHRLKDQVDYIAFSAEDLANSGINVIGDVPGETYCAAANALHVDIDAASYECFELLCHNAFDTNRPAFRVTRGEVKTLINELRDFGCSSIQDRETDVCGCADEALG